jgi:transposase-like protein
MALLEPEDRNNQEQGNNRQENKPAEDRLHRKIQGRVKYRILMDVLSGKKNIKQGAQELNVSRITVWKWMRKMEGTAIKALTIEKAGRKAAGFTPEGGAAAEFGRLRRALKKATAEKCRMEAVNMKLRKELETAKHALSYFRHSSQDSKKNFPGSGQ